VDPWFIVDSAPDVARLMRVAREVNDSKPHHVTHQVLTKIKGLTSPVIACLGLAFKAEVDDLRESPAVEVVEALAKANAGKILAVDPYAARLPVPLAQFANVSLVSIDQALAEANVVVLLVNHRVFVALDRTRLAGKIVVDTRGVWR
jgi:UDP-N-acetyl-D-mannosaminuronic acid dehydrogenase